MGTRELAKWLYKMFRARLSAASKDFIWLVHVRSSYARKFIFIGCKTIHVQCQFVFIWLYMIRNTWYVIEFGDNQENLYKDPDLKTKIQNNSRAAGYCNVPLGALSKKPLAAFTQTKRLGEKHETRYFRQPHLYKNIAIYPLCSCKHLGCFFRVNAPLHCT